MSKKHNNDIFIPFAYCSIERASSFLTEALDQTITVEDIEHLIELNIIKPCIHIDRFNDNDFETPTLDIFYTTTETINKPINDYFIENENNGFWDLSKKIADDAPEELKQFLTDFECDDLYGFVSSGTVDNKDYLTKIGMIAIEDEDFLDELKNDGYGLSVGKNSIHFKSLAPIYGLCEIDSYFVKNILETDSSYHAHKLPIKLLHNPKYTILSLLSDVVIKRDDLKITADNLRAFINLKKSNQPIKPNFDLGASLFDQLEGIQGQVISPQRTQPKQSAFICWLIESHPQLGKKTLEKPFRAWDIIQAQLSEDSINFDENLTKETVGNWIKRHTDKK